MKILYICKYFLFPTENYYGGRSYHLLNNLSKNNNVKVDVIGSDSLGHLLNKNNNKEYDKISYNKNYNFYCFKIKKYKKAQSLTRVFSWIDFERKVYKFFKIKKTNEYDIVIASSPSFLTLINGFFLSKKIKSKFFIEIRDIWPLTLTDDGEFSKLNPLIIMMRFIEIFIYHRSDQIIGTMPKLDSHIKNNFFYRRFFKNKNIECIPFGIDEKSHFSLLEKSKINLNKYCKKDQLKVLYSGSIGITNSLQNYFKLIKKLRNNYHYHFFIVGDGPLLSKYKKKYNELDNLTFIGSVLNNELLSVLKQSDVLFLTCNNSKVWHYGQSMNKLIDYMLAGRIILMEYTGYISMLNSAAGGYIISHNKLDDIVYILNYIKNLNANERNLIGERSRKWLIRNRSYEKLSKQLFKILNI